MSGTGVSDISILFLILSIYFSLITNVHPYHQKEDYSKLNMLKKLLKILGKFNFNRYKLSNSEDEIIENPIKLVKNLLMIYIFCKIVRSWE